jgi:hypothetical protein
MLTFWAPEQAVQAADVRQQQLRVHELRRARIKTRKRILFCKNVTKKFLPQ